MAHFAEVKNTDNKVLRVVVISNDDVMTLIDTLKTI